MFILHRAGIIDDEQDVGRRGCGGLLYDALFVDSFQLDRFKIVVLAGRERYRERETSDGKLLVRLDSIRNDCPEQSNEAYCPRCVFQYAYEGATDDGLLAVRTWTGYGGSGIFSTLLILRMGEMTIVERKNHKRGKLEETGRELTLNTVARVLLGDREKHSINVVGTQIYVDGEGLLSGPLPLSNQEPKATAEAGTT